MTPLSWAALATLVAYALFAAEILRGNRAIRALRDYSPESPSAPLRVSIVVAARDEARNIREALRSHLSLRYPDYELIVVDDRSTDGTGAILDGMAGIEPRMRVLHVGGLPPGWLGKNHALAAGAGIATGDLLLFTDADVVMEPTALSRAVNALDSGSLDHLALSPSMPMKTLFLRMFGAAFLVFFSMFVRPWKARDPKSGCHVGIGAFNLVRADAYRAAGGHEAIRMRPDDDLKLGKILKRAGFRQDMAYAPDFLAVEWYASVGEVVRGLEKNLFAGCDYRLAVALSGAVFHLFASVWPYAALFATGGATRALYGGVVLVLTVLSADCASFHGAKRRYAAGFPFCTALFVWIILRTTFLNLAQGGIRWRGTFYRLEELRANRV
jgi:cellulose synthase/poly-beta-1,6-N-acetylglucosamine synthase-like glycosyltransferase